MLEHLKKEASLTVTENGAPAYETTGSDCLDMFASIGAVRDQRRKRILDIFTRAFIENKDVAMKLLFFARDIRGGLGERRVFRLSLEWLANSYPESVRKNIANVPEYGRYDDLLVLFGTPCEESALEFIKEQLKKDIAANERGESVSLLGKWLPSVNASSSETVIRAKKIARYLGMSDAEYRRVLTSLRKKIAIIENNLREVDYTFDYSKQPSRAMFKYRKAFIRNDGERYMKFQDRVSSGEEKLHADNVCPYELISPLLRWSWHGVAEDKLSANEQKVLNNTWESLPNFCGNDDSLAVIDTSGSMYMIGNPLPAAVALSLGIYFAEHNKGRFKNHFITFSEKPKLVEIKGETVVDKVRYLRSLTEVANTNIEAVYNLILNTAVKNRLPQSEMPARLVIISDMEFDECAEGADETAFENAKKKYAAHGYKLPDIVFWNVNCRGGHMPVKMNEQGVALVSGATPRLFSMIAGGVPDPFAFMMDVVNSPRYAAIKA